MLIGIRFRIPAILLAAASLSACAQSDGAPRAPLTAAQVQRIHPDMSPVFIAKCDKDGDGLYTNVEMQCVNGIYQQMYIAR